MGFVDLLLALISNAVHKNLVVASNSVNTDVQFSSEYLVLEQVEIYLTCSELNK